MASLDEIENQIERVVGNIRQNFPDWLCRRGCDSCCRRLAELPLITRAEWERLKLGLGRLPQQELEPIQREIRRLGKHIGLVTCPMLNQEEGACRVYPYRPLACRSYGYFMQKGVGLHCKQIEAQADQGLLNDVVWGNQDALERDLHAEGPTRSLSDWLIDPVHGMS